MYRGPLGPVPLSRTKELGFSPWGPADLANTAADHFSRVLPEQRDVPVTTPAHDSKVVSFRLRLVAFVALEFVNETARVGRRAKSRVPALGAIHDSRNTPLFCVGVPKHSHHKN